MVNENQLNQLDRNIRIEEEYLEKKRIEYEERQQKKRNQLSSLAKYSITIISALVVLFPSTTTFIQPPYEYDRLLVLAFIFAIIGFFINCSVILLTDFSRIKEDARKYLTKKVYNASAFGSAFTALTLIVVFIYVLYNVYIDRVQDPEIVNLKINPTQPIVNSTIEFSGQARDQDLDHIMWEWHINKLNANDNLDYNQSTLPTFYWIPKEPGPYVVSATIMDDKYGGSNSKKINFIVNEKGKNEN